MAESHFCRFDHLRRRNTDLSVNTEKNAYSSFFETQQTYTETFMPILDFFVAVFTATLSGTGIGGGGLYVIYLTLARNVPQLTAQGINLAFFIAGALSSMLIHLRKRRFSFRLVLLAGVLGAIGSLFGAFLANRLDTVLLSKIFGGLLVLCGLRTLFSKVKK